MRISDWSSDVCSSDLDYTRRYTGMPFLVRLEKRRDAFVAGRFLRASDFAEGLGQTNNPDWKTVALDESSGDVVAPNGSIGFRWGEDGKWNIHPGSGAGGAEVKLRLSLNEGRDDAVAVQFPYFGGSRTANFQNSAYDLVKTGRECCREEKGQEQ